MGDDDATALVIMLASIGVWCSCSSMLAVFAIKKSSAPESVKKVADAVGAPIEAGASVVKKATTSATVTTPPSPPATQSATVTAPIGTRISEMGYILANGFAAGKLVSKQMTGSDGRTYFVVPNGTEASQLEGLVELGAFIRKLYASALKRHGSGDVYTSRLSTLVEDPRVSYIHSQDYYQGNNSFTSLYPSGKPAAAGIPPHPYICMVPWWQSIIRNPQLMPKDAAAFKKKVTPYWHMLFLHEIAHAIAGLIGHQEYWVRAWNWLMHEAEAAGVWTHASLLASPEDILSKSFFQFDPSRFYSWDPYTTADMNKAVAAAKNFPSERGQNDVLWGNPAYKKGLGCPCT